MKMEEVFIKNIIKKGLFRAETDAFLPFGGKGAILLEKVWIFCNMQGGWGEFLGGKYAKSSPTHQIAAESS